MRHETAVGDGERVLLAATVATVRAGFARGVPMAVNWARLRLSRA
jgi:hypothetical protein